METLLLFSVLVATVSVGELTTAGGPTTPVTRIPTPEPHWANLNGKMVTLSNGGGDISFSPPSRPDGVLQSATGPYTTTQTPKGVSVCLSYATDINTLYNFLRLRLDTSDWLYLKPENKDRYVLSNSWFSVRLNTYLLFWPTYRPSFWTRICLTIDSRKNVAQMFSGGQASIRRILPYQGSWLVEPYIVFWDFNGQVTDVQMWDYPLSNKEVVAYMSAPVFGPVFGSVLQWSHIGYSINGNVLLEDKEPYWEKLYTPEGGRRKRTRTGTRTQF